MRISDLSSDVCSSDLTAKGKAGQASGNEGGSTASINLQTSDLGVGSTDARSSIDIVNHDVRNAIANAERAASRSRTPEAAFSSVLDRALLGQEAGVLMVTAPVL